MSIQVLKKNSKRFKDPISGKADGGFSLVGGHRNVGYVGQTNLAKSVTRTPFRGTTPVGHGGHNGKYVISIANSGSCSTNDPSIIKKTVKNTKGSIIHQYPWLHSVSGNCCDRSTSNGRKYWVKSDDSMPENYTQGVYIKNLKFAYANRIVDKTDSGIKNCDENGNVRSCKAASYHIGGKFYYRQMYSKNLTRYPLPSSEYQTSGLMKKNNLPTPPCLAPFPMNLSHNGCDVNYLTPEQAIAAGALPSDWMNCNPYKNPNCVKLCNQTPV
jgi:hypothetical protein